VGVQRLVWGGSRHLVIRSPYSRSRAATKREERRIAWCRTASVTRASRATGIPPVLLLEGNCSIYIYTDGQRSSSPSLYEAMEGNGRAITLLPSHFPCLKH